MMSMRTGPRTLQQIRCFATSSYQWRQAIYAFDQIKQMSKRSTQGKILLDVREKDEFSDGAIPNALNLPLSTLEQGLKMEDASFKSTYGFGKPDTTSELVFYCRSGKRSTDASDIAEKLGYKKIGNYKGSWNDWQVQNQSDESVTSETVNLKELNERELKRGNAKEQGDHPLQQAGKEQSESVTANDHMSPKGGG